MASINTNNISEFGNAALALDQDFGEFERLAHKIESLSIDSDSGFDQAQKLLVKIDECGKRIGTNMQLLSQKLEDARKATEEAAQAVSTRALAVQQRQKETQFMLERLRNLGETVKDITSKLTQVRQDTEPASEAERKTQLANRLPEFDGELALVVEDINKLMLDARTLRMKTLERNADSLRQSLQAARHRFTQFVERLH